MDSGRTYCVITGNKVQFKNLHLCFVSKRQCWKEKLLAGERSRQAFVACADPTPKYHKGSSICSDLLYSPLIFFFINRLHSAAQVQAVTVSVLFCPLHGSYGSFESCSSRAHVPAHFWKRACWTWGDHLSCQSGKTLWFS